MISSHSNYYDSSSMFHGFLPEIMGTRFDIVIVECQKFLAESVWRKVIAELERLDKMCNRFDVNSELSNINQQAGKRFVPVSDEMWSILTQCKRYHLLTFGLFDITLNDLSGVLFDEVSRSVAFPASEFYFDLGGYAKGYAMENIKKILLKENIHHALVNLGDSSIVALGHHPFGDCWSVSIENPFKKGEILREIKLKDNDLSTSGNMPGHTGHIIHPFNRLYNKEKKMVCVTTCNSIDAEVLTTVLMVAGTQQKERILANFDFVDIKYFSTQ